MSMHRISLTTTANFLQLPTLPDIEEMIKNNILTVYCAEDRDPELNLIFSYRGREIAHRLSMDELQQYHSCTQGEGKIIIFLEASQPDAFYRIAQNILIRRGDAKKDLKAINSKIAEHQKTFKLLISNASSSSSSSTSTLTSSEITDPTLALEIKKHKNELERLYKSRSTTDAKQLCFKIVVNSLYGVFGASSFPYAHIPIAALITLLGRAKLCLCARLIINFYYREILTNPNYEYLCEMVIPDNCADEDNSNNNSADGGGGGGGSGSGCDDGDGSGGGGGRSSSRAVKTTYNRNNKPVTLEYLDKAYKYLLEVAPFHLSAGKPANLSFFDHANRIDHDDIFTDTDIIIYTDTDGILFSNFLDIECDGILKNVNKFMMDHFKTDCLRLENDKNYYLIGILGKKTYTMVNRAPQYNLLHPNGYYLDTSSTIDDIQYYFQKLKCVHNGFERNAPLHIKRIYNYIVSLVFISNEFELPINVVQVYFDIFSYLKYLNQYELAFKLALNEHQLKTSNLARYIERNTTTYQGRIDTMFILDQKDIFRDCYKSLIEWETDQNEINYVKSIKNHAKTIWRILTMANQPKKIQHFLNSNENAQNIIKHIQSYVSALYGLWGKQDMSYSHPLQNTLKTVFDIDNFVYEQSRACSDNIASDNYCAKKRRHMRVDFSFNLIDNLLPNFVVVEILKKLQVRVDSGDK